MNTCHSPGPLSEPLRQLSKGRKSEVSPKRGTRVTPAASGLHALAPLCLEMPHAVPTASCRADAASPSAGHGNFPYLCGNLNDVVVSPLLYACYQNSQSISRAYEQYGASTIQPISEETQLLLTVYYLVQLGESPSRCAGVAGTLISGVGNAEADRGPSPGALVKPRGPWGWKPGERADAAVRSAPGGPGQGLKWVRTSGDNPKTMHLPIQMRRGIRE